MTDRPAPMVPAEVDWRGLPPPGAGTFRCGACDKSRMPLGRKLQRVHGLKTWVCAVCAGKGRAG